MFRQRTRGRGASGTMDAKDDRADPRTHGLDLRAFFGGVGGHSLALQRMVPHSTHVANLLATSIQTAPLLLLIPPQKIVYRDVVKISQGDEMVYRDLLNPLFVLVILLLCGSQQFADCRLGQVPVFP